MSKTRPPLMIIHNDRSATACSIYQPFRSREAFAAFVDLEHYSRMTMLNVRSAPRVVKQQQIALAYADQTKRDYQALVDAFNRGEIPVETGV